MWRRELQFLLEEVESDYRVTKPSNRNIGKYQLRFTVYAGRRVTKASAVFLHV